ncbi:zf-HC2 domain-containing protein [Nitriliruptoraceae bacterium ZYF776]|nr:zf-HC2 domain-containing protein [Profundirhabdus halotolerans]
MADGDRPVADPPGAQAPAAAPVAAGPFVSDRHVSGARLSAFLDDELDEPRALTLTRHVTGCDRCRAELEDLRAARAALRRLPGLQAPVLTSEVRSLRRVRRWSRRVVAATVVGAAALVLGAAAYVVGDDRGGVVPPIERFLTDHLARTAPGAELVTSGPGDR